MYDKAFKINNIIKVHVRCKHMFCFRAECVTIKFMSCEKQVQFNYRETLSIAHYIFSYFITFYCINKLTRANAAYILYVALYINSLPYNTNLFTNV